jgi:hypothetical protein
VDSFPRSCRLGKKPANDAGGTQSAPSWAWSFLGPPWFCLVAGVPACFVLGHSLLLAHLLACWSCRWMILHVPTPSHSLPFLLGPFLLLFSLLHLPTTSSAAYLPSRPRATGPS